MQTWFTTYTGLKFDYANPQPSQICIDDIAHSLSGKPRFAMHTEQQYYIGQHCILGAKECLRRGWGPKVALRFLLHDASEAYLCDLTSPLKHLLIGYKAMEHHLESIIYSMFGVFDVEPGIETSLKGIDTKLVVTEYRDLMQPGANVPWDVYADVEPFKWTIKPKQFKTVKKLYLEMFNELTEQCESNARNQ